MGLAASSLIVSDHRAPHLAAIGPAHVQKYASPARLPQPAAPCGRLFRGYLTFVGLPRDQLPLIVRQRPGQSGFTLLELGVVITLLALFSLLTIPLFGGTKAGKLGYSARCLNGTIKYLFNEAALTGREHRLILNLDRGTYSARMIEADGEVVPLSGIARETKLAGNVQFRDLQLPDWGTITTGEVTVRIHPAGWVEETSVHLEDGSGNALTLHVMPLTGTAEIFEGYKTL